MIKQPAKSCEKNKLHFRSLARLFIYMLHLDKILPLFQHQNQPTNPKTPPQQPPPHIDKNPSLELLGSGPDSLKRPEARSLVRCLGIPGFRRQVSRGGEVRLGDFVSGFWQMDRWGNVSEMFYLFGLFFFWGCGWGVFLLKICGFLVVGWNRIHLKKRLEFLRNLERR